MVRNEEHSDLDGFKALKVRATIKISGRDYTGFMKSAIVGDRNIVAVMALAPEGSSGKTSQPWRRSPTAFQSQPPLKR